MAVSLGDGAKGRKSKRNQCLDSVWEMEQRGGNPRETSAWTLTGRWSKGEGGQEKPLFEHGDMRRGEGEDCSVQCNCPPTQHDCPPNSAPLLPAVGMTIPAVSRAISPSQ